MKETVAKVVVTDYGFESIDLERSILEPLGCAVSGLKSFANEPALIELVKDADCVITQFAPVTGAVIRAMRRCKVIVRYGIGVDNVDLKTAADRGIPVCNVPDYCIDEVADHAVALILSLARKIPANSQRVRSGGWGLAVPVPAMQALKDLTIGVVGFGRIGREVVSRLKGFKCRILVFDPVVNAEAVRAAGCEPTSLDALVERSDLVTLHCPSTEATKYMINSESIARMKPGAMLVNTSRGTLIKTADLAEALRSGALSAAAMDVTDPEPLPADSPLRTMDNVIITPHIASVSLRAIDTLRRTAADIVAIALRGKKLPNVVNGVIGTGALAS